MKTLLDLHPTALDQNLARSLSELHKDCLASFLLPKEHHEGRERLLGTGFFVATPDATLARLYTARHVLEEFDHTHGRITVDTTGVKLGDIGLRSLHPTLDLARWDIPSNALIEQGITHVPGLPIFPREMARDAFEPTDSFMLLGYPGSKNASLDFREGQRPDRAILALALHGSVLDAQTGVRTFEYRGKATPEKWNPAVTNPPPLARMTGSPCLRFVHERKSGRLAVVLAGVFYAWSSRRHELSVAAIGDPWMDLPNDDPEALDL
jgi:hypothetical protein